MGINDGDQAWVLTSAALVQLMTPVSVSIRQVRPLCGTICHLSKQPARRKCTTQRHCSKATTVQLTSPLLQGLAFFYVSRESTLRSISTMLLPVNDQCRTSFRCGQAAASISNRGPPHPHIHTHAGRSSVRAGCGVHHDDELWCYGPCDHPLELDWLLLGLRSYHPGTYLTPMTRRWDIHPSPKIRAARGGAMQR